MPPTPPPPGSGPLDILSLSDPLIFTWLGMMREVMVAVNLDAWAYGLGGILLVVMAGLALIDAGPSGSALLMAWTRIIFACALFVAVPGIRTGVQALYEQFYQEGIDMVGPALVTNMDYIMKEANDKMSLALGFEELEKAQGVTAAAGAAGVGVAAGATASAVLTGPRAWVNGLVKNSKKFGKSITDPFVAIRNGPTKALSKIGRSIGGPFLKILPSIINFLTTLLLIPFLITSMLLVLVLTFLPVAIATFPNPKAGIFTFSTAITVIIIAMLTSLLTPLTLAIGLNIAIISPITNVINAVADTTKDFITGGQDMKNIFGTVADEGFMAAMGDALDAAGASIRVVALPLEITVRAIVGLIIGAMGGLFVAFKLVPMLWTLVAGRVGAAMAGARMIMPSAAGAAAAGWFNKKYNSGGGDNGGGTNPAPTPSAGAAQAGAGNITTYYPPREFAGPERSARRG